MRIAVPSSFDWNTWCRLASSCCRALMGVHAARLSSSAATPRRGRTPSSALSSPARREEINRFVAFRTAATRHQPVMVLPRPCPDDAGRGVAIPPAAGLSRPHQQQRRDARGAKPGSPRRVWCLQDGHRHVQVLALQAVSSTARAVVRRTPERYQCRRDVFRIGQQRLGTLRSTLRPASVALLRLPGLGAIRKLTDVN